MKPTTILIVCSGNTCRSAMAEAIAKDILSRKYQAEPERFQVISAGTFASYGMPAAREAIWVMNQCGIDISSHQSKPLTNKLIDSADVIYTMTSNHRLDILEISPQAAEKTFNLNPDGDIQDPVGLDIDTYEKIASELRRFLTNQLEQLVH